MRVLFGANFVTSNCVFCVTEKNWPGINREFSMVWNCFFTSDYIFCVNFTKHPNNSECFGSKYQQPIVSCLDGSEIDSKAAKHTQCIGYSLMNKTKKKTKEKKKRKEEEEKDKRRKRIRRGSRWAEEEKE